MLRRTSGDCKGMMNRCTRGASYLLRIVTAHQVTDGQKLKLERHRCVRWDKRRRSLLPVSIFRAAVHPDHLAHTHLRESEVPCWGLRVHAGQGSHELGTTGERPGAPEQTHRIRRVSTHAHFERLRLSARVME
eukprot:scaffold168766_cov32-Tisochrysis_lutea.AAC.2